MDTIKYKNKEYPVRWLHLGKHEGDRMVAQIALSDIMYPNGHHNRSREAEVDNQIWYYCDEAEWKMDDKTLIKVIKKGYGTNE